MVAPSREPCALRASHQAPAFTETGARQENCDCSCCWHQAPARTHGCGGGRARLEGAQVLPGQPPDRQLPEHHRKAEHVRRLGVPLRARARSAAEPSRQDPGSVKPRRGLLATTRRSVPGWQRRRRVAVSTAAAPQRLRSPRSLHAPRACAAACRRGGGAAAGASARATARLVQDDLGRQPARVVRGDRRHHRRVLRGRARAALTARRAAPRERPTGGARGQGMPRRALRGCTCCTPNQRRGSSVKLAGGPPVPWGGAGSTGPGVARASGRRRAP